MTIVTADLISVETPPAVEELKEELSTWKQMMNAAPDTLLNLGIRVAISLLIFVIGSQLIHLLRKVVRHALSRSAASDAAKGFIDSVLKTVLYVLLILMIAVRLGLDATAIASVVASAGVTIGLAVQGSLKNCIGGVLILLLKPFAVGDYITESAFGKEGTVTEITIFYTKLLTVQNEVVLIPNGGLADTCIKNYTGEPYKRVSQKLGISYSSDIRKAKEVIDQVLRSDERILYDRGIQIFVDDLADSSVVLGVRFWVESANFWAVKWDFLENIKYAFDENGVGIPFPQMDVHMDAPAVPKD